MIRVTLIGAGAVIDELYCSPLRRLERAGAIRVTSVVDPNQSRARLIAARFKSATAHPSCEAAYSSDSSDLAIVASPPAFHAEHACFALERGSHVLCEKPMTTTMADARGMNSAAAQSGRTLGVAFPRRFYANFADVARLVTEGELGDDLRFAYRDGATYDWSVATSAAFVREQAGGGALLDKGVHMLDQLDWIFGRGEVTRSCDDSLVGGVETNSLLELSYSGARGTLHVSWEYPLNNGLHISGSSGEVFLDGGDIRSYRRKSGDRWMHVPAVSTWPADMRRDGGKRTMPGNHYACFEVQLVSMLRHIAYGEPFPVTGIQATQVQEIVDHAYALAEPLPCPWLPKAEQKAMRSKHWKATTAG